MVESLKSSQQWERKDFQTRLAQREAELKQEYEKQRQEDEKLYLKKLDDQKTTSSTEIRSLRKEVAGLKPDGKALL